MMESYLRKLIDEGENQQLDFKYCVSDSRKIARTLAAFANTDGGRLLIGIRDNGSVAGIRSEEEMYMVDTAVHLYCNPEVPFTTRQHNTGNRTILEVIVPRGENRPYRVKDESGRWITYFRHGDQNLVAGRVLLEPLLFGLVVSSCASSGGEWEAAAASGTLLTHWFLPGGERLVANR